MSTELEDKLSDGLRLEDSIGKGLSELVDALFNFIQASMLPSSASEVETAKSDLASAIISFSIESWYMRARFFDTLMDNESPSEEEAQISKYRIVYVSTHAEGAGQSEPNEYEVDAFTEEEAIAQWKRAFPDSFSTRHSLRYVRKE